MFLEVYFFLSVPKGQGVPASGPRFLLQPMVLGLGVKAYPNQRLLPTITGVPLVTIGVPAGQDWGTAKTVVSPRKDCGTPQPELGYPLARTDRLHRGWYTSCGFLQEDFLVIR